MCCTHGATLVPKFTVTQQTPALVDASVSLSLIQILQLVDVVATLGLSLLHVDVGQDALDDGDLHTRALPFSICGRVLRKRKELVTYGFLQNLGIRVVCWSVL